MHADLAGPFVPSASGGFTYALVLIDDHTRYKWVYFMRQKSEAPAYMRTFISSLNSLLSRRFGADEKMTVAALHTDNAGEFLSREFVEMLDKDRVSQSTCPPHVHELNGIAERAIRTIFSIARSNLVASGATPGLWPHLVRHALDVSNRCTGPTLDVAAAPESAFQSSFELFSGKKPKVMAIMSFGCRASAVKPR